MGITVVVCSLPLHSAYGRWSIFFSSLTVKKDPSWICEVKTNSFCHFSNLRVCFMCTFQPLITDFLLEAKLLSHGYDGLKIKVKDNFWNLRFENLKVTNTNQQIPVKSSNIRFLKWPLLVLMHDPTSGVWSVCASGRSVHQLPVFAVAQILKLILALRMCTHMHQHFCLYLQVVGTIATSGVVCPDQGNVFTGMGSLQSIRPQEDQRERHIKH